MKKRVSLLIMAMCMGIYVNMNFSGEQQNWSSWLNSKWNYFTNSSYVKSIQAKISSYFLPAVAIVPGALMGRFVAAKKFMQPVPSDPGWKYLITRRNEGIITEWGIVGGIAAALATYKILSYYQKNSQPTSHDNSSSDDETSSKEDYNIEK
jgi:hypothetical protein